MILERKRIKDTLPWEEIKKRARILVVDDMDFNYLGLFKKDGYTIEKWDDIDDLPKLESGYYDVILLDIQGIGKELSKEQGFGILKHIKAASPTQIVIAYSNADFSLRYQGFFHLADSTLDKAEDYTEFKHLVDSFLSKKFSIGFYIDRIVKAANPYISDTEKLRKLAKNAIINKSSQLEKYIRQHIDDEEIIKSILSVIATGIKLLTLL